MGGQQSIGQIGIDVIKGFEGFEPEAYQDVVGVWTVGYGHTKTAKPGMTVTEAEAEDLLRRDVESAENDVRRQVKVDLNHYQFDALVSWVFNLGGANLKRSTMLKVLNQGRYDLVPSEMLRWVNADGQVYAGLVRRRQAEARLFAADPRDEVIVEPDGDVIVRKTEATRITPREQARGKIEASNPDSKPLTRSRTMQSGGIASVIAGFNVAEALAPVGEAQAQVAEAANWFERMGQQMTQLTQTISNAVIPLLAEAGIVGAEAEVSEARAEEILQLVVWGVVLLMAFRIMWARVDDRRMGRR